MNLKHFDLSEFDCTHTGLNRMDENFLRRLDELRTRCNFPFSITSGYRDKTHPVEAIKHQAGQHNLGVAADIRITNGAMRHTILREAMGMEFAGIGVARGFIHIDDRIGVPVCWTY